MAIVSNPIILKVTNAGKLSALSPNSGKVELSVNLTHVAIGSGRYTATGNETGLKTLISKIDTVSGDIDAASNTLHFSATIYANTPTPVYELGLLDSTGGLFAIAASLNTPLFTLYPNVAFVVAFGISLNEANSGSVTVTISPNNSLTSAIMQNHLAAPNPHPQYLNVDHLDVLKDPHPQYVTLSRFQLLLDTMLPVGYLHHTHDTVNPKPQFDALLGISTAWRRLAGKIIVGTDPADPYIKDVGLILGQKGMTEDAGVNRPHVYPLYTTNVFERYNPNDFIETVWLVNADKTAINEGEGVRFTVSANNLPDGQILQWTVKEGALNTASNDITAPVKTTSGTTILKNGAAIIDCVTAPDNNQIDPQMHVRLTVGLPANLSINVPIVESGRSEKAVHISSSSTNGVVLDEYYKQQSGAYPTASDNIRFIVDDGVDIIAPDTDTAAIEAGINWPIGSQATVENHGRILGRGGDAGLAATYYYKSYSSLPENLVHQPPEAGGDGGTAVKGGLTVENYGFIAGGGGGGGGAGFFRHTPYGHGSSGGGGGGAPLGRRYPNPKSYEEYVEHFPTAEKYFPLPPLNHPSNATVYDTYNDLEILGTVINSYGSYIRGEKYTGSVSSDIIRLTGYDHYDVDGMSSFYIPDYLDETKTTYRLRSWGAEAYRKWVNIGFTQSTDATIDNKGRAGIGFYTNMGSTHGLTPFESLAGFDVTQNRGADGGAIGENGQAPMLEMFYANGTSGDLTPYVVSRANVEFIVEPATGGLAGFVKEGAVVINNFAGGSTKGR